MRNMNTKRNIRILLVDDDASYRKLLQISLTKMSGMEIVGEAENGKTGVELMHQLQPDIVIMDVCMPIMNGIEATRLITTVFPDVKVMAFTSSADDHTMRKMFEAGASDFLTKNCGFGEITSAIKTMAESKEPCLAAKK